MCGWPERSTACSSAWRSALRTDSGRSPGTAARSLQSSTWSNHKRDSTSGRPTDWSRSLEKRRTRSVVALGTNRARMDTTASSKSELQLPRIQRYSWHWSIDDKYTITTSLQRSPSHAIVPVWRERPTTSGATTWPSTLSGTATQSVLATFIFNLIIIQHAQTCPFSIFLLYLIRAPQIQ